MAERLRIAREIHDSLGHGLTLTALRAEAAACLVEREPRRSRELLAEVAKASRSALEELHLLLQVLRQDTAAAEKPSPAMTGPEVEAVVQRFSGPGMHVDTETSGPSRALGDVLEVTVAAIVAEGLSNIARHADATRATVRLSFQETTLVVEVADDGRGPCETTTAGFGLLGAAERVAAAGGELAFGPGPQGGGLLREKLGARTRAELVVRAWERGLNRLAAPGGATPAAPRSRQWPAPPCPTTTPGGPAPTGPAGSARRGA